MSGSFLSHSLRVTPLSKLRIYRSRAWRFFSADAALCASSSDRPGSQSIVPNASLPRKEVIQPHLPIRLPCYDFTPVIGLALDGWSLAVTPPASGTPNSHGVTGGVYKARERIHRGMLIRDY